MSFFMNFDGRQRLFLSVFLISLVSVVITFILKGWLATILMIFFILTLLLITKNIWTVQRNGRTRVHMYTLQIALIISGSSWLWGKKLDLVIKPIFLFVQNNTTLPIKDYPYSSPISVYSVLVFMLIVMFFVNYFASDRTVMKEKDHVASTDFPKKDFNKSLKLLKRTLFKDITNLDSDTNWSEQYYTPLDADVEIRNDGIVKKKVLNLLAALRKENNSKSFLLLGDPGSGKSIALRMLVLELLKEIEKTKKVPFYINLKDWTIENDFSEKNFPSAQELYRSLNKFILQNLSDRFDSYGNEFLNDFYKPMLENGNVFLILDSFDEISALMDVDESSKVIDVLSEAINILFSGVHESRGILASRIFRRPSPKYQADTVLEIRSFHERKIIYCLDKFLHADAEKVTKKIFTERQELIPLAMNPFHCILISSFYKEHNLLPQNQSELYSNYLLKRLKKCADRMEKYHLTPDQITEAAADIAEVMFKTPQLGLEAPIEILKSSLPQWDIECIVDILVNAKLGRIGSGHIKRFSFVHRRFNEFFISTKLLREKHASELFDYIPSDSRWRDALILYCELTSDNEAINISKRCWQEISNSMSTSNEFTLRAIHCLRFLKEAFRSRKNCITSFQNELSRLISTQITNAKNLLNVKLAVEAVGLINEAQVDEAIVKSFLKNNEWINETALRSCRHLTNISKELKHRMIRYVDSIHYFEFLKKWHELKFSLGLSNGFKSIYRYGLLRYIETLGCITSIALCHVLFFKISLVVTSLLVILFTLIWGLISLINTSSNSQTVRNINILFVLRSGYILLFASNLLDKNYFLQNFFSFDMQISGQIIVNIVVVILLFFLLPWSKSFYYIPYIIINWEKRYFINLLTIVTFILIFSIPIYFISFFLSSMSNDVKNLVISMALGLISLFIIFNLIKASYRLIQDIKLLKKVKPHFKESEIRRETIAEYFVMFKSNSGRLRFVKWLYFNRLHAIGNWPQEQMPNHNFDKASTLLAIMEEKWLGLDRA
ncbi:hypothetical protein GCM10023310_18500 [Paenibacillus vulneris]|uniref:NACHT domain-containing protein n=1 Tax=Paenibacillus vulneris TaxID=1133364 RepID=A0ABW3UJ31_9BACL